MDGSENGAADKAHAAVPDHGRFVYRPITRRPDYRWPGGAGLAVYLGFNVEHFAFGTGLGAAIGPESPAPDVLNHSWREYGNRVGAWRCIELFDQLGLPTGALLNTAVYDHAPELAAALAARGDELISKAEFRTLVTMLINRVNTANFQDQILNYLQAQLQVQHFFFYLSLLAN